MATLKETRTQFIKLCGRHDLVVDLVDYVDNGADWFIQAGQRMLDKLASFPKDLGRYFETVSAGTYYVTFDGKRTIREVWAANATARWRLSYLDPNEFRELYAKPYGDVTRGKVCYYTRAHLRAIPDFQAPDAISGYAEEITDDTTQLPTSGIMFMPPVDETIGLEIWGEFKSPELSSDSDVDYWSVNHPDALVFAALYKLETSYRNSEGARDWMNEIMRLITDIDKDVVAEDAHQAEEMEG